MNCKYKSFMTKKKAFTLIELLIVIAIIGILFIVLVSKVDFATDKAKATGVQTDFRSFQLALETVSKEKAGFNIFGWNTGDANANGVRDSVDEGDTNEDGIYQDGETWTGHKKYLETWTEKYSLIKPGTTFADDGYDKDAIFELETAINKNLDPKLQITIDAKTGLITMANGAQDPWNTQYHGAYISAEDGMDRGAIVMYSNGANQKFGSEHDIANGVPTVIVPDNNKDGADDYSLVVCYTYTNGYGEVGKATWGFSNNQTFFTGNGGSLENIVTPDNVSGDTIEPKADLQSYTWEEIKTIAKMNLTASELSDKYNIDLGDVKEYNGYKYYLVDLDGNNYDGFIFLYQTGQTHKVKADGYNDGGYASSELATYVDNLYHSLENDDINLFKAIKTVNVKCNDGKYNKAQVWEKEYGFFVPSHREVGGVHKIDSAEYTTYLDNEGTMFEFLSNDTNRSKIGNGSYWWTRSAQSDNDYAYYDVAIDGNPDSRNFANGTNSVVIAFVVG